MDIISKSHRDQEGVTFIELLFAVAVLSILMLVAIPAYSNYKSKVKISEGLVLVSEILNRVEETYRETGVWPEDNTSAGVGISEEYSTKWVKGIYVELDANDKAQVRIIYNASDIGSLQSDDDLIFRPIITSSSIIWDCTGGTIKSFVRPKRCKS
ncbi:MAG: pilin [Methylococcales bacterium]